MVKGMKKELADYLNKEAVKTKAKQPVRMSSIPSKDIFVLRDIVDMILEDDDLRKGFRIVASVPEMRRVVKGLNVACNAYLDHDLKMIDGCLGKIEDGVQTLKGIVKKTS
jgi:hypothetical protein